MSWTEGLRWLWQSPWGSLDTSVVSSTSHSDLGIFMDGFRTAFDRILLSLVLGLVMGA